jgi:hypothetical protein
MTRQQGAPPQAGAAVGAGGEAATGEAPSSRRVRGAHWALLSAVLILAVALRVYGLSAEGLWIDEIYSLQSSAGNSYADMHLPRGALIERPPHLTRTSDSAGGVLGVWASMGDDQHPPLYFMLLRVWRGAFGSSEAALRSLSVVASVASVAAVFDVGRMLLGPGPAIWACLLVALSLPQIAYAQEARSYALLQAVFLGAASALARVRLYGFSVPRAVALAMCLLGTMLTHYLGAAGCIALGTYAVFALRGVSRRRVVAVMVLSAAVYAIIWGPMVWRQAHGLAYASPWLREGGPAFFGRWAAVASTAPFRLFSKPAASDGVAPALFGLILILPFVPPGVRRTLLLPALCAAGWLAFPAIADLIHRSYMMEYERYFLAGGPFVALVACGLLAGHRRAIVRHVIPAAVAFYCAVSIPHWAYADRKADWRGLGAVVNQAARGEGDVVVYFDPSNGWYASLAYLAMDHYAPDASPAAVFLDRQATPELLSQLRDRPGKAWVFTAVGPEHVAAALPGFDVEVSHFALNAGVLYRLKAADAGGAGQ